ncbi:MAG: hypothetical protein ACK4SY_07045 [Pyrobaculum sp.]
MIWLIPLSFFVVGLVAYYYGHRWTAFLLFLPSIATALLSAECQLVVVNATSINDVIGTTTIYKYDKLCTINETVWKMGVAMLVFSIGFMLFEVVRIIFGV